MPNPLTPEEKALLLEDLKKEFGFDHLEKANQYFDLANEEIKKFNEIHKKSHA